MASMRVIMIVELLGRPADHARYAIEEHMKQLDSIKHVEVMTKKFSDPKKVDEKNDLYTCFCEVEFTCENLQQLFEIVFDFMPSSIEILEPSKLSLESFEATSIVNNLSGRLHRYDDAVKILQNREKKMLQEGKVIRKLLLDHNLIDEKGKILQKQEAHKDSNNDDEE